MRRRFDLRRIKSHLTYSVPELAETLQISKCTISRWVSQGLRPIEQRVPYLFDPTEIVAFVKAREKPRQPLEPGEFLCVACKGHQRPLGNVADLRSYCPKTSNLVGICPLCRREMYRRVRTAEASKSAGDLQLRYEEGCAPITENRDLPHSATRPGAAS